jgi:hypothetical protein
MLATTSIATFRRGLAAIAMLAAALALLTRCSQTVSSTVAPAVSSHDTEYPVGPGMIGAGSFPRSFLIPETDTSIRIGG